MIIYEITATVLPHLAASYERYMRVRHIPDLLATGNFVGAALTTSGPGRFRIRYEAADQAALDRYLAHDAARLRAHAVAEFPEGVELSREVWTVVEVWGAPPTPPALGT